VKSRLALSIVLSVFIASAFLGSCASCNIASAKPTRAFTLSVNGTAYDLQKHVKVDVALSVVGMTDGKLKTEMDLYVRGGDVVFKEYYGTFYVSRGCGELVFHCHYIALYIWLTPKYGGNVALWCMAGRTATLSGQTLKVSLFASHVILPLKNCPRLDDLDLSGTISPVY